MITQSLVTSGFDLELLFGERFIKYFLLASFDTGTIPWWSQDTDEEGRVTTTIIHPPEELLGNRLYEPHADFDPHPFDDLVNLEYTADPRACNVTLLPEGGPADIRIDLIVSVIRSPLVPGGDPFVLLEQSMYLDARFFVASDPDPNTGVQTNVRLELQLVDIGGPLIDLLNGLPPEYGWDEAETIENLKEDFDRSVPLGIVGENGSVQQIVTKKLPEEDGRPKALGIYANLNLKSGPGAAEFVGPRGELDDAQNFLHEGHHMAFAFQHSLYPRLGRDIFYRLAHPDPNNPGGFYYPLDPSDPGRGKIIRATVYPANFERRTPTGETEIVANGDLVIEVEGELFVSDFPDPNFKLKIVLTPIIADDGVLTFRTDIRVTFPILGVVLALTAVLNLFTLKLLPLTLMVWLAKHLIEQYGESIAVPLVQEQMGDASFVDSFPNKLTVEKRRWDPMYFTLHQVVSLVKEVQINDQGLTFSAYDLRLGKEPKPLENAVIRSEVRDAAGSVSGLLYRINDWNAGFEAELDIIYPAVDRMAFEAILPPEGEIESFRVHLIVDQAVERIQNGRIVDRILYTPYKIDEREHQIYQILTLSTIEVPEIKARARRLLRRELEQAHEAEYRERARMELLVELGREPTPEEMDARYEEILSAEVDAGAAARYRQERERFLSFDLEPFEYADLQQKNLLVLEHLILEIIEMRESAGGTVYYRDRPDADEGDNLLFLPRYRSGTIVRG